jgi:hypothetical protein
MAVRVRNSRILVGPEDPGGRIGPIDWNKDYVHSMLPICVAGRYELTDGPIQEMPIGEGIMVDPIDGTLSAGVNFLSDFSTNRMNVPPFIAGGTQVLAANTIYAVPIWFNKIGTLTKLSMAVTALVAASNIKLGLAKNRASGWGPGVVLANGSGTGTVSSASTGQKTAVISVPITKGGLYWLLLVASHAPTINSITLAPNALGCTSALVVINCLTRAFTYGDIPADESAQTYTLVTGTNNAPFIAAGG